MFDKDSGENGEFEENDDGPASTKGLPSKVVCIRDSGHEMEEVSAAEGVDDQGLATSPSIVDEGIDEQVDALHAIADREGGAENGAIGTNGRLERFMAVLVRVTNVVGCGNQEVQKEGDGVEEAQIGQDSVAGHDGQCSAVFGKITGEWEKFDRRRQSRFNRVLERLEEPQDGSRRR